MRVAVVRLQLDRTFLETAVRRKAHKTMKLGILLFAVPAALLANACAVDPHTDEAGSYGEALSRSQASLQAFHAPCNIWPGNDHCWSILGWERGVTKQPFVRLKQGRATLACVPSSRPGVKVVTVTGQRKTFDLEGVSRCDDAKAEPLGHLALKGRVLAPTKSVTCNDCEDSCSALRQGPLDCWGDHWNESPEEEASGETCDDGAAAYDACVATCNANNNSGHGCGGSGAAPGGSEDCGDRFSLSGLLCRLMAY
jgi:hypothetical protein